MPERSSDSSGQRDERRARRRGGGCGRRNGTSLSETDARPPRKPPSSVSSAMTPSMPRADPNRERSSERRRPPRAPRNRWQNNHVLSQPDAAEGERAGVVDDSHHGNRPARGRASAASSPALQRRHEGGGRGRREAKALHVELDEKRCAATSASQSSPMRSAVCSSEASSRITSRMLRRSRVALGAHPLADGSEGGEAAAAAVAPARSPHTGFECTSSTLSGAPPSRSAARRRDLAARDAEVPHQHLAQRLAARGRWRR